MLSLRGYARHRKARGLRGGCLKSVQRAIAAGRITVGADGRIEPVTADQQWAQNTDPGRQTPAPDMDPQLQKARAERMYYEAQLARLEYEERAASLCSVAEMKKARRECNEETRRCVLAVVGRVSKEIAQTSDEAAVARILDGALRDALFGIAGRLGAPAEA